MAIVLAGLSLFNSNWLGSGPRRFAQRFDEKIDEYSDLGRQQFPGGINSKDRKFSRCVVRKKPYKPAACDVLINDEVGLKNDALTGERGTSAGVTTIGIYTWMRLDALLFTG